MTATVTEVMPQTGARSRLGGSGRKPKHQGGASVREIEGELKSVGQQVQAFGSFEDTPADLLRRFAELLHGQTLAQAREEGMT